MSDYMLGKISRHLVDIKNNTSRPSGVPVSQYNDLVVRFNEMSQAYANEANTIAQLRARVAFLERDVATLEANLDSFETGWHDSHKRALQLEQSYKELQAENLRLQGISATEVVAA